MCLCQSHWRIDTGVTPPVDDNTATKCTASQSRTINQQCNYQDYDVLILRDIQHRL